MASALAQLIFDHGLRLVRGVNRCKYQCSSCARRSASIHPHEIAMSSTSGYPTDALPDAFFAILTHTPAALS